MADYSQIEYSPLLSFLFYPRRHVTPTPPGAFDLPVPVEKEVSIFCRFFGREKTWPWILYFHENGEVVSDYDEIALFFSKEGDQPGGGGLPGVQGERRISQFHESSPGWPPLFARSAGRDLPQKVQTGPLGDGKIDGESGGRGTRLS